MNGPGYERLSGLDQSFLHFETPSCYMHVALTAIFEPGSLTKRDGGIDIKRIRRHIASRLPLIPRYRQRLGYIPVSNDPVWIDDDHFDLEYHVRHTNLPRPGTDRQLQTLCARILERPLDRRKPLWETWFIEGLSGGRFAMLNKVHHCMVDGIAGVDLLAALLALTPYNQVERPDRWEAQPAPTGSQMLRDDLARRARASLRFIRHLPGWVSGPSSGIDLASRLSTLVGLIRKGVAGAPEMPFNQPIGPHRRVEWQRFEMAAVKAVKNRLGGTVNDVVLATVAGAVRRFLRHRKFNSGGTDLRTVIPVSTRANDERGVPGNRVSVWIAALPIDEPSPRQRYARVCEATAHYKETQEARGAEILTQTAEWTTSLVLGLAVRLVTRQRAFNLIVTNVPGPDVPLYLLDAPLVAAYPHVPLFENQGMGIALFSYAGQLHWGLVGDWDVVPDLHRLSEDIAAAFAELCEIAEVTDTAVTSQTPALPAPRQLRPHARVA